MPLAMSFTAGFFTYQFFHDCHASFDDISQARNNERQRWSEAIRKFGEIHRKVETAKEKGQTFIMQDLYDDDRLHEICNAQYTVDRIDPRLKFKTTEKVGALLALAQFDNAPYERKISWDGPTTYEQIKSQSCEPIKSNPEKTFFVNEQSK